MIDISPRHLDELKRILAAHLASSVTVWVYGSRVNGTAKPFSDIDLLLKSSEAIETRTLLALAEAFDDSHLPFRVDINDWHQISPEFQTIILQGYEPLPFVQCHAAAL